MKKILVFSFFLSTLNSLQKTAAQNPAAQDTVAQNTLADSGFYSTSMNRAIHYYTDGTGASSNLYNGIIYQGYNHHVQGHPFFAVATFQEGSISYDGIVYPDIPLSYDLVNDQVIIPNNDKSVLIQLLKEKLAYFYSSGHLFIRILPDSAAVNFPGTGYYDNLYSGKATVLVKREKKAQTFGKAEEDLSRFVEYDHYYLLLNNRYYEVRNRGSVLDALQDKKTAMKDFFRGNKISFKKDPAYFLVRTAEYYSQLKN
jgi:hypothetical protein